MKKYTVNIKEVHNLEVVVEANSENEARAKAEEDLASCAENVDFDKIEYSHTLEKEDWTVCLIP